MEAQVSKVEEKKKAASVKEVACHRCHTPVTTPFCPACGNQVNIETVPEGWGPGLTVRKLCRIPPIRTIGGQELDLLVNGVRYFGEMHLTWDEWNEVSTLISRRLYQDFISRNGDPAMPREINFPTMQVRGNRG